MCFKIWNLQRFLFCLQNIKIFSKVVYWKMCHCAVDFTQTDHSFHLIFLYKSRQGWSQKYHTKINRTVETELAQKLNFVQERQEEKKKNNVKNFEWPFVVKTPTWVSNLDFKNNVGHAFHLASYHLFSVLLLYHLLPGASWTGKTCYHNITLLCTV